MPDLKTPFRDIVPPLSSLAYNSLKESIVSTGAVLADIIVTTNNEILDGHNRYDIANKYDIPYKTRVLRESSKWTDDQKKWQVEEFAIATRNLSPDQLNFIRDARNKRILKDRKDGMTQKAVGEKYGINQSAVSKVETLFRGNNTSKPDARVKVSPAAKKKVVKLLKKGKDKAEVAAEYGITPRHASNILNAAIKQEAKEEKDKESAGLIKGDMGIHLGDFRDIGSSVPSASTALIFTDPPYDKKSLSLYDDLAYFACRILIPGGSLITFLGQYALDDVLQRMVAGGLKFYWPLCCYHTGDVAQMKLKGIKVHWKPMLWFVKDNRRDKLTFVDDLIESKQEKDHHPWQQSVVEASYYIGKLTKEGELVVDPFCGGGTTALAAKGLNRKWWSCDIESKCIATTEERLNNAES